MASRKVNSIDANVMPTAAPVDKTVLSVWSGTAVGGGVSGIDERLGGIGDAEVVVETVIIEVYKDEVKVEDEEVGVEETESEEDEDAIVRPSIFEDEAEVVRFLPNSTGLPKNTVLVTVSVGGNAVTVMVRNSVRVKKIGKVRVTVGKLFETAWTLSTPSRVFCGESNVPLPDAASGLEEVIMCV
jgi:hypothetical protein